MVMETGLPFEMIDPNPMVEMGSPQAAPIMSDEPSKGLTIIQPPDFLKSNNNLIYYHEVIIRRLSLVLDLRRRSIESPWQPRPRPF